MVSTSFLLCGALLALFLGASDSSASSAKPSGMVWVAEGISTASIIVPVEVPTKEVHQAANDLAGYVERMTGRRPATIQGTPDPLPERAVWVGYQPVLNTLFPELDFDFQHPEEIHVRSSHVLPRDHAYNDQSDQYREKHPEYFALLADGTRGRGRGRDAKLCPSNPSVAKPWLDNQMEVLRDNPRVELVWVEPAEA